MRKSLAMACLFLAVATSAMADDDHERARAALERGEVLPLLTILERLATTIDGDIIETELDREKGRWIYEISYIDRNGRLTELEIDAADATVLKMKRQR